MKLKDASKWKALLANATQDDLLAINFAESWANHCETLETEYSRSALRDLLVLSRQKALQSLGFITAATMAQAIRILAQHWQSGEMILLLYKFDYHMPDRQPTQPDQLFANSKGFLLLWADIGDDLVATVSAAKWQELLQAESYEPPSGGLMLLWEMRLIQTNQQFQPQGIWGAMRMARGEVLEEAELEGQPITTDILAAATVQLLKESTLRHHLVLAHNHYYGGIGNNSMDWVVWPGERAKQLLLK